MNEKEDCVGEVARQSRETEDGTKGVIRSDTDNTEGNGEEERDGE